MLKTRLIGQKACHLFWQIAIRSDLRGQIVVSKDTLHPSTPRPDLHDRGRPWHAVLREQPSAVLSLFWLLPRSWLCSLWAFRGGHVGVRATQAGQRLARDARVRATLLAIGRRAGAAFAACIDASLRCCEQERQHENHRRVLTSREVSADCRRMLCCVKRRIGAARKRTAVYVFSGHATVSWSGC